jgi:Ser/Thr protein kinase RdoA (MazF antagonist)
MNDDAAGGLRGLRAEPSAELFDAVRDAYGRDVLLEPARQLAGSSSLNLRARRGERRCVLRVYRSYVTAERLHAIGVARGALAARGIPCSETLPTREGHPWFVFAGRLVELEPFVEHDAHMDSWERLDVGLPVLGRIQTALQDVDVGVEGRTPMFANHIESAHALDATFRGTRRIRSWHPTREELQLAKAAEELAALVAAAEQPLRALVPRQLVHGDFWDDNVLFFGERLVLVTDLEFMGERPRVDDLALTLYFTSREHLGDPPTLRRLVDAYETGLLEPLTSVERAALALAMARQPLWSLGGWIARLDDERTARRHAAAMHGAVEWALGLVRDLDRWQAAFA